LTFRCLIVKYCSEQTYYLSEEDNDTHSGGGWSMDVGALIVDDGALRMWWLQPRWGEGGVVPEGAPMSKSMYEQEWEWSL